jgi:pimeloyl-ACP methyl ester carboxylesterase
MSTFRFSFFSFILFVALLASIIHSTLQGQQTDFVKSSDGVKIAYQVSGSGEANLIFVHGWTCDKTYWKYQAPYFAKQYRVITIDLAGHGESGIDRKQWSVELFSDDVSSVIHKLNLEKYILIGHSLGGLVVLEVARRNLIQTQAVIGVDIYKNIPKKKSEEDLQKAFDKNAEMYTDFVKNMNASVPSFFTTASDSSLVAWVTKDMASNDPAAALGTSNSYLRWQNYEFLNALQESRNVPVLAINSDRKITDVDGFRKYHPSFQAVTMKGLGHFVMMENPEGFNKILQEFILKLK